MTLQEGGLVCENVRMIPRATSLALLLLAGLASAQDSVPPKELGTLRYSRDLDATLAKLKRSPTDGKPIFVVFQEIPG